MQACFVPDWIVTLDRYRASLRHVANYIAADREPRMFRAVLRELIALDDLIAAHRAQCPLCRRRGVAVVDDASQLFPPVPDSPRDQVLAAIKREAVILALDGDRSDFKLAESIFRQLPELKRA